MNPEAQPQPEPSARKWSDDERQRFLDDRTRLLQRLLHNRQSWQSTHERLGGRSTLKITWIDHQGFEQQTLLTESFLAGYATVMRAVACDLIICGEDGAQIAEHLFADLSGIDGEQDT
jgi:hypothetical protein